MDEWLLVAAVATVVGASTQGATGMGFSLVAAPVLLVVLPATSAMMTLLVLATVLNLTMLIAGRARNVRWVDVQCLMVAAMPGLVAGATILRFVPKPILQVAVGLGTLGLLISHLARGHQVHSVRKLPHRGGSSTVGFISGVLTTSTGLNGPPLAFWLTGRGASPAEVRDSLQAAFLLLSVIGAPTIILVAAEGASSPHWVAVVLLIPTVWAGNLLGKRVFRLLSPQAYRVALMGVVGIAGLSSLAAGLLSAW